MAKVAFIVADDFEDSEFKVPYDRVREAGHQAVIIGVQKGTTLEGKKHQIKIPVEVSVDAVSASEFDALVIPGGYSPDKLRTNQKMVGFVRDFNRANKTIAAICHAGWMLVESEVADGRTLTSWPSIRTDLINSGARWVDREVVEDKNLITSRKPDDLPAFCEALLRHLEARERKLPAAPEMIH